MLSRRSEAAVLEWLRTRPGEQTTTLSICGDQPQT
jgi:hypothetical protein